LDRPVVAFCNIENEIYAKANKQATNSTTEDSSEDEEGDRNEDTDPVDKDGEFYLDDEIDLESPLLNSMLSDRQLEPGPENFWASTTAAAHVGAVNLEPTEDDWENL